MFIVYEAATGRIVAVDLTETQAENVAGALRAYRGMNVSVQSRNDREGGNVHETHVRVDEH